MELARLRLQEEAGLQLRTVLHEASFRQRYHRSVKRVLVLHLFPSSSLLSRLVAGDSTDPLCAAAGGGGHVSRRGPALPRPGRLRQEVPLCPEIQPPGGHVARVQ